MADQDGYVEMMRLWRDTAKAVSQLATAAMVLPTFFLRELLGVHSGEPLIPRLNGWLLASWAWLLVAIVFGTTYQITAARLIGDSLSGTVTRYRLWPRTQFWIQNVSLALGIMCFLVAVTHALWVV